jgi:hypothetical protein
MKRDLLCIGACAVACVVVCLQPDPVLSVGVDDDTTEQADVAAGPQPVEPEAAGGAECVTASGAPYVADHC